MGIPVPKITMTDTIEVISKVIIERRSELFHVVTLNPEITMSCQHDQQLRSIIDDAGLLTADGIGIVMPVAIGVCGSLDIIAGKVKRAPANWQKLNMEWLFRLINQPSRWRRQLILPRFAIKALLFKEKN
ncbi:WecB/TagA/CpsF family glycosyltransferase [Paenibacillus sp. GCM10027630]|uniref:WecB/TagA/CpsF family glycosyltransferase n=1 Tax=Paenibacillus sp. GCM10027630 TaxID=3273415 RepID=UPI0036451015